MKIYLNKKECKIFKNNNKKIIKNGKKKLYKHWILNPLSPGELIQDASVNAITGLQEVAGRYTCTGFIELPKDAKTISVVNALNNQAAYHIFAVYDENKNFIKGSCKNPNHGDWYFEIPAGEDHMDFEMPENAKYIRFSSTSDGNITGGYYWSETPNIPEFIHESNKTYNVNTVSDLKVLDVKTGDIVVTQGYNSIGDLGNATYDIMTYDEFNYLLPNDIKISINSAGRTTCTPVDEHGNHTLNNGLIAKLRLDGEIRPEQWGAIAEESFNSCQAFVHMFAHVKTGTIRLKKDGVYGLGLIYEDDTVSSFKDNPYKSFMCGGLLGGQFYAKPIMANIHNVKIVGDNSLITNHDKMFGSGGMGVLNFAGIIDGLKFDGVSFDGKGRTMMSPNKNSNHIIFYAPATFANAHPAFKDVHPLFDKKSNAYINGYIQDMEVANCSFKDAGAMYRTAGDWGGDHILIINPTAMDNLNIHHNRFESWGRWVLAVDLGGNCECLTNTKFDDNICIGANAYEEVNEDGTSKFLIDLDKKEFLKLNPNYTEAGLDRMLDQWRWRALGMIDFEAKKCFDNVSFQRNHFIGSGGWAINGCSRINKNFVIKDNYYIHVGGGYPYSFECYSGMTENWLVEGNTFPGGCGFRMGYFTNGMTFRNNVGLKGIRTFGLAGNIIIENNSQENYGDGTTHVWSHESNNYDDPHFPLEEVIASGGTHIVYKNNEGCINAKFTDPDNIEKTSFFTYDIDFTYPIEKANVVEFTNKITIDPTMYKYSGQGVLFKGVRLSKPIENSNMLASICYLEKGQMLATNCQEWGVVGGDLFKNKLIENFSSYNGCNWAAYASRNNLSKISIVCTESGYYTGACEYGFRDNCTHISFIIDKGLTLQDNAYVNTDDDIYWTKVGGKLTQIPTHKEGMVTYTDEEGNSVDLYYIGKVMKAELVVE